MSQLTDELMAELKKGPKGSELAALLQKMMDNAVKANADEAAETALERAGVLTENNLHSQIVGPLDQWARDRCYEAITEALKQHGSYVLKDQF